MGHFVGIFTDSLGNPIPLEQQHPPHFADKLSLSIPQNF